MRKKILCFLLTFVFVSQNLLSAAPAVQPLRAQISLPRSIEIPSAFGRIEKVTGKVNAETPVVIHIQDAHGYPEAQKNIAKILEHLMVENEIRTVALEAVFSQLDSGILKVTDSPEINRAVAKRLIDFGELTGAEIFALEDSSRGVLFVGAEDADLYYKSKALFTKIKSAEKTTEALLSVFRNNLTEIEGKSFSPELKEYVQARRLWTSGKEDSLDYVRFLVEKAPRILGEDLFSREKQFERPALSRAAALFENEKNLKSERAASELSDLQSVLKQKLSASPRREFLLKGMEFLSGSAQTQTLEAWLAEQDLISEVRTPRHFFEILQGESKKSAIQLLNYPQFLKTAGLVILRSELELNSLLNEMKTLEPRLEKKLVKNRVQKNILDLGKDFDLTQKLLNLELSREDYDLYLGRGSKVSSVEMTSRLRAVSLKSKAEMVAQDNLNQALEFYRLSRLRDEKLAAPAIREAQEGRSAVVVTGGFHSAGIETYLQANNIPYISIVPKMDALHAESFYEKIMLGEDLKEGYFTGNVTPSNNQLGAEALLQHFLATGTDASASARQQTVFNQVVRAELVSQGWSPDKIEKVLAGISQKTAEASTTAVVKRSENRVALDGAIEDIRIFKTTHDPNELLLENSDGPSYRVSAIEYKAEIIFGRRSLSLLSLSERTEFALAVFDEINFPHVHKRLVDIMHAVRMQNHKDSDRLEAKEYAKVVAAYEKAERADSVSDGILLRFALNKLIFCMPRDERRALEKETLIQEFIKELNEDGAGDIPAFVFLTDLHGAPTVAEFIGHAFGLKDYKGINSPEKLIRRLAQENIDVDSTNLNVIGGSDIVDRGPRPHLAFRVLKKLTDRNKLRFINGNHDIWEMWYVLGLQLRVEDTLREIFAEGPESPREFSAQFEKLWKFVQFFDWSPEQESALKEKFKNDFRIFYAAQKDLPEAERDYKTFANQILNAGSNPNHSKEWWAQEWGIHGNWFDTLFDEINQDLINEVIEKVNQSFAGLSAEDKQKLKETLQNEEALSENLKTVRAALLENLESGNLFRPVDLMKLFSLPQFADLKNQYDQIKKQMKEIKTENEQIRVGNEPLAKERRFSEMTPQKAVPSPFPATSQLAEKFLGELMGQIEALHSIVPSFEVPERKTPLINQQNARVHPMVVEMLNWNIQNFALLYLDILSNLYVHGIIPISSAKGENGFDLTYKLSNGQELHGVQALERIQLDVRQFFEKNPYEDSAEYRKRLDKGLGQAFDVINQLYSDILLKLKPEEIKRFIGLGGPSAFDFSFRSSFSPREFEGGEGLMLVGHVEPEKLRNEKIKLPWLVGGYRGGGLMHGDFAMSPGYEGLGGYTALFRRVNGKVTGFSRMGYSESEISVTKAIEKLEKKLKSKNEELGKAAEENKPALSAEIEKLQGQIQQRKERLKALQEGASVDIEDLTMQDIPQDRKDEVSKYHDGRWMMLYYLERFLADNIQTYGKTQDDSHGFARPDRPAYYERMKHQAQERYEEWRAEFEKAGIEPSIQKNNGNDSAEGGEQAARSEVRLDVPQSYGVLKDYLGNRPYADVRWVALNMADGILMPIPADLLPKILPFLEADLFNPFQSAQTTKAESKEPALHISALNQIPQPGDNLYAAIALALSKDPNRHIRLAALEGTKPELEAANLAFAKEYPQFAGQFEIVLMGREGLALQQGVQRVIDEAVRKIQDQGITIGSQQAFRERVSFSSQNAAQLEQILAPLGWKIQDDLPASAALEGHLMGRSLDLSQSRLEAERIRKLTEIKSRVISAARDFLSGEDLALVEKLFDEAIAARQLYISA